MLPPRRLKSLLKQAVEMQADRCSCHDVAWTTDIDNVSLLVDHDCGIDTVSTLQFNCQQSIFFFTKVQHSTWMDNINASMFQPHKHKQSIIYLCWCRDVKVIRVMKRN